jgi:hypothetical protein
MGRVVVAMDPRKRSATIEMMDAEESVLGGGRFGTDAAGHAAMKEYAERWPDRVWAIEGCQGARAVRQAHSRLDRLPPSILTG